MPLQPFDPIVSTFTGTEVEPLRGYKKHSVLEGPIITAAWDITGLLIGVSLEYHLSQYVSNKTAYEQLTEAIKQSEKAQSVLEQAEAQIRALWVKEGSPVPTEIAFTMETAVAAIIQCASERAKLTRERAEFGLSDAKDALRRSDFPLLVIARLIYEGNVIWIRSLETQRLLLQTTGRTLAAETGGDYTGIEGLYQERGEARYDVSAELTPGKPLTLELEVLGPVAPAGVDKEGPEIMAGAGLQVSNIAVEYEPERAPAIN